MNLKFFSGKKFKFKGHFQVYASIFAPLINELNFSN